MAILDGMADPHCRDAEGRWLGIAFTATEGEMKANDEAYAARVAKGQEEMKEARQKEEGQPPTKHTTHTDALDTLGTIIDETAQRDAIHLAVEPCVAGVTLHAGMHVGRGDEGTYTYVAANMLGIVDPFLKKAVMPGERFWLVVYPRQITSLRHVWEHPAFPAEPQQTIEAKESPQFVTGMTIVQDSFKPVDPAYLDTTALYNQNTAATQKASEQWLREWCSSNDAPRYETLMRIITGVDNGADDHNDYVTGGVYERYVSIFGGEWHADIPDEFWNHVEVVTGQPQVRRPSGFSCSC